MPFGISAGALAATAAGVSAATGIAGQFLKSGDISGGQSQATGALQQGIQTATNQLSPWSTTGVTANAQEGNLLGLNGQPAADAAMSTFQASPGYQFQLTQGLRGVDAGAAAAGMLRSGATLKGEQEFGQGLANTTFGNYFNQLQQLSGNGLTAAGGIASAATGGAAQLANTDASAATAQANSIGSTASGIGSQVNQLANNTAVQNWLTGSGGVSPTAAYNNGLYQAGQFAQQPAGTFGPFA